MKTYTRDEVLGAMYDLKKQGFKNITAMILQDGTLALACNNYITADEPQILIDSINSWCDDIEDDPLLAAARIAGLGKFDYWWIFD